VAHRRQTRHPQPPAAIERPIVFAGNDRPGVMMAGAVRSYLNRFAVRPGENVAIFTNNDDGWRNRQGAARAGGGDRHSDR